jgi:hypothetical protein
MKSSPLLGPFGDSEFWEFSLLKIYIALSYLNFKFFESTTLGSPKYAICMLSFSLIEIRDSLLYRNYIVYNDFGGCIEFISKVM